jgi:hypothetical protein
VKHNINTFDGFFTGFQITDVANDKLKIRMKQKRFDVFFFTCGEIIEANDVITLFQKPLDKVGTDKAGTSGDKNFFVVKHGNTFEKFSLKTASKVVKICELKR